jgi:hypothetical protein
MTNLLIFLSWTVMETLQHDILRTLLYYDIWQYPLTAKEVYAFLPGSKLSFGDFCAFLASGGVGESVGEYDGFYFVKPRTSAVVLERKARQRHARRMWKMARLSTHIIKRFPFVRGVFISGDLSKDATIPDSDVDFFILTSPGRLWIARALLILFKKAFLLNKKKFFCLNSFVTTDFLRLEEHNVYLATEIGHLKPLYGSTLFHEYIAANSWIKEYFPNFDVRFLPSVTPNDRRSTVQRLLEAGFALLPADAVDGYLLQAMRRIWRKRYPQFDDATRDRIFRSTRQESRAYGGNFQDKILSLYEHKLREHGVAD